MGRGRGEERKEQRKEIERNKEKGRREGRQAGNIHTRKGEVKLSFFEDGMILYVENMKESTKRFLKLISLSRVAGYKKGYMQR